MNLTCDNNGYFIQIKMKYIPHFHFSAIFQFKIDKTVEKKIKSKVISCFNP